MFEIKKSFRFDAAHEGGANQYVGDLIAGRSLPEPLGGDLYIGFYFGERTLGQNRQGVMIAYEKQYCKAL